MRTRHYHNGFKAALLLGGMWALLLLIGSGIAYGTGRAVWIFIFAGIGLLQTAWSYWNSATMALRSMIALSASFLKRLGSQCRRCGSRRP